MNNGGGKSWLIHDQDGMTFSFNIMITVKTPAQYKVSINSEHN